MNISIVMFAGHQPPVCDGTLATVSDDLEKAQKRLEEPLGLVY